MAINDLIIKIIEPYSTEYWTSVALRSKMLREPLGLKFNLDDLSCDHNQIILTIWDNLHLVATLNLMPYQNNTMKMRQVAVDDKFQGKGIGQKLVLFSEDYAKEHGFEKMTLHARETAISFYRKMQYELVSEKFIEVGIPHFEMNKWL